ncbi:hypothetical protein N7541_011982 [Penicillium brevicompactum]|uniref:Arrestin-like N-terminal domain-containing protein n=1 Tax=Penicillium brevicompactum TaxID=5074 RepID=A0A9W9UIX5_PENBR|nr:hypothetical protein N7541_011982 [Penicillium brevicompactum]
MKPPNVEITVHNLSECPFFRTHDKINGEVIFTPRQQTSVEDISIELTGVTKTEVENMNSHIATSPPKLEKKFLSMQHPIPDFLWDTKRLEPGQTYRFPFTFVVPEQLPVQACYHQCAHHQIQQHHLRLPASLGFHSQNTTQNHSQSKDMSPNIAKVCYGIRFTVWKKNEKEDKMKKIHSSAYPVQIMPLRCENSPILVPPKSKYYRMSSEKNVSKGVMQRSSGKFTASSNQPPAIHLQSPRPQSGEPSTVLKLDLQFEPSKEGESPPRILAAQFQLRAMTFFALEPWQDYPDLSDITTWDRQGFWSEYVSLQPEADMDLEWKATSSKEHDRRIFTTSVEARVSLPSHQIYPTTFHSCLVSRVYALKVILFYRAHGKKRGTSRLSLSVPVEVC